MDESPHDQFAQDSPVVPAPLRSAEQVALIDNAATAASPPQRKRRGISALALAVGFAAWLVPGLGHLLTGKWVRAAIFFLCVGGLALTGYALRGNVFARHSNDPFGTLGFLADVGSGMFYALAKFFERAGPDVSRAAGDYGTRFIAAAGVVNLLGVFDAFEIAAGRRS